ncbi:MAG TPA: hypothetical protein VFU89_00755 [Rhabdochlamydiaceae bacterium]|nr:hypothetical protein [Rhabdochlamydiaceae bacterium]
MKISISSGCYAGGCLVLGALNAYANPVQWITTFAVGVLAGLWLNNTVVDDVLMHQSAITDSRTAAPHQKDANQYNQDKVNKGLKELISNAIPGKIATVFNLMAGALNWIPRIDVSIKGTPGEAELVANLVSSFVLGYQVGAAIQLGRLWFNPNPGL